MAEQGKCAKCRVRISWKGSRNIKKVRCPQCMGPLKKTSYLLKWPVKNYKAITKRKATLGTYTPDAGFVFYLPTELIGD